MAKTFLVRWFWGFMVDNHHAKTPCGNIIWIFFQDQPSKFTLTGLGGSSHLISGCNPRFISNLSHLEGEQACTLLRGLTITMVINHLPTGKILLYVHLAKFHVAVAENATGYPPPQCHPPKIRAEATLFCAP